MAADGHDPLDEAATMALDRRGLTDADLWLVEDESFALKRGDALDLAVTPAARGRGFGTALADAALASAGPRLVAWSHGDDPAAAAIARSHGFTRSRELWMMRRRDAAPVTVDEVPGVRIRGYLPSDADEVIRVNAAAFAHHPEQGSMDATNLADRMAESWFDPAGLLVADTGDGLLAFHWTKQHSPTDGEVYVVAVDPAAQGRGLGRAITAAGLEHLAGLGIHEVLLYVESDNAPALATYGRLGFEHTETHVQYARPG